MKGTCEHQIFKSDSGGVLITNDLDEYYYQVLESPEEINSFIDRIIEAAQEVFGPSYAYKHRAD